MNPRASRTVPVVSKVMGVPMIPLAARLLAGASLKDIKPEVQNQHGTAVKFPVFSSHAIQDVDVKPGPEMKSTGEGMCVAFDAESALKKSTAHVWEKKAASIWKAVMRNWNVRLKRRDLPYAKMRSRHGQSERIKRSILISITLKKRVNNGSKP